MSNIYALINKPGLFFLLIGIQLLIAAALISEHRENQTSKSSTPDEKEENSGTGACSMSESKEKGTIARDEMP